MAALQPIVLKVDASHVAVAAIRPQFEEVSARIVEAVRADLRPAEPSRVDLLEDEIRILDAAVSRLITKLGEVVEERDEAQRLAYTWRAKAGYYKFSVYVFPWEKR